MEYGKLVGMVNLILNQYVEATVRQVYYRLVSPPYQYMANTRSMYVSFDKMMVRARERGDIDWTKIVDRSRRMISAYRGWGAPGEFIADLKERLESYADSYAIDMWANQDYGLRVLVEKDALAEIIAGEALPYQVSVVPGRGYNSFTQLMAQAQVLAGDDKSIVVLYFGDFDPSGLDIERSGRVRLRCYSGVEFEFVREALTEGDIAGLPSNPTKTADTRAKAYVERYGDACWELDALPPDVLRVRVRQAIWRYIDAPLWNEAGDRLEHERGEVEREIKRILGKGE